MITPHATWNILDSTKLQDYMTCPRMYFYRYILGWRPDYPQIDLVFGSAWHKAMAVLLEQGYSNEVLNLAISAFEEEYRKTFPNAYDDEIYAPKMPSNAIRGLLQYIITYNQDKFEVLAVEVAGTVAISDTQSLHYRIDGIVRDLDGKVYILEHKTGSNPGAQWQNQWALKVQIGTYAHVLYCTYPSGEIAGVHVNGFFPHNPPMLKLNREMRAGAKDNEFLRMKIWMPPSRMRVWLHTVNHYAERLALDTEVIKEIPEVLEQAPMLKEFVMNTESCSKYRGCPYRDFCATWSNPLHHCDTPPIGFITEFWDPRDSEKEAKTINNIPLEASSGKVS